MQHCNFLSIKKKTKKIVLYDILEMAKLQKIENKLLARVQGL